MTEIVTLEPLRSLCIRYWYSKLRARAGLTSDYSMEKTFEPDAFSYSTGGAVEYRKNKWSNYRKGIHRPQSKLLKMVEKIAHGSTRELNHPLWLVLDLTNVKIFDDDSFLRLLVPEVQRLVLPRINNSAAPFERLKISSRNLEKLSRNADLDVLACLTWLLRESCRESVSEPTPLFLAIHKALILLAAHFEELNLAENLLQRYIEEILPLGLPSHLKLDMTPEDYLIPSLILNTSAEKILASRNYTASASCQMALMNEMLSGKYGLDLAFAAQPKYSFIATNDNEALDRCIHKNNLRDSAISYLIEGPRDAPWKPSFSKG